MMAVKLKIVTAVKLEMMMKAKSAVKLDDGLDVNMVDLWAKK
jgi:hypothetical protein